MSLLLGRPTFQLQLRSSLADLFTVCIDVTRSKDAERIQKLKLAAKAFDHSNQSHHDSDVKQGAVAVVCGLLCSRPFLLNRTREVQFLCTILLHLLRCSDNQSRVSFCTEGTQIITSLLELIEVSLTELQVMQSNFL